MTREEAIAFGNRVIDLGLNDETQAFCEMAIKALGQETILDQIRAEIKEWYFQADKQELAKDPCVVDAMIDLFIRTIDKYRKRGADECRW